MLNLKDKIVVVTGATAGIGRAAAEALAKEGAHVHFTTRDMDKGELTKQEIIEKTGNGRVNYYFCDLASFKSIRDFAEEFNTAVPKFDVLVNNAGGWNKRFTKTEDGIEMTWQANHLSPFLLTNLLLPKLKASAPARIINVASEFHRGRIHFDDVEFRRSYMGARAYSQSKLANILFTAELARRLEGSGVTANSMHPGALYTNIYSKMNPLIKFFLKTFLGKPEIGARTILYLAGSSEVEKESGKYFAYSKIANPRKNAKNMETAKRLWELSEKMTGLKT